MTINQLRQYRKLKGRKLLLEAELQEAETDAEEKRIKKQIDFLSADIGEVEQYVNTIDDGIIADMIRAHYIHGRSWTSIAHCMGGGNTDESVRKQCHRYIKKS